MTVVATDFAGRSALITGAGRGIGRAVALGLADAGAGLILVARSDGQLAETRAMLLARGTAAEYIRVLPADAALYVRRDKSRNHWSFGARSEDGDAAGDMQRAE
jgi:NAD(P)-dependent dehydrogenase (short-subunit alcohol dehydrogenase family)